MEQTELRKLRSDFDLAPQSSILFVAMQKINHEQKTSPNKTALLRGYHCIMQEQR